MPTLKDLQNAVSSANTAYQNAVGEKNSAEKNAKVKYDEYKGCKTTIVPFGTQADVTACKKGSANNYPGCAAEETCEDRSKAYNQAYESFFYASQTADNRKKDLDSAQQALDNFIKTDPEAQQQIIEEQGEAKSKTVKWIFFGLILLVLLGGGFWMAKKTQVKKGYIIGGGVLLAITSYLLFFGFKKST